LKTDDIEQAARQSVLRSLEGIPFILEATITAGDSGGGSLEEGIDCVVEVRQQTGSDLLIIEVKRNGEPRTARDAVGHLLRCRRFFPNAYPVFVAPYISPRSAEICRADEVGYIDFAGNCHLALRTVYIHREGCPNPHKSDRKLKSLYSPKASRVLRVLLGDTNRTWKLQDLAGEAGVSLGLAHNVKSILWEKEWIEMASDGIHIADARTVLLEWAAKYVPQCRAFDFYSFAQVAEIEQQLATVCERERIGYAFTGFSGAARLASAVRYRTATAYVAGDMARVGKVLELKPVDSGANVSLLQPTDDGVLYGCTRVHGVQVASPVQVYLDLQWLSGRTEEAAEVVLRNVLGRP